MVNELPKLLEELKKHSGNDSNAIISGIAQTSIQYLSHYLKQKAKSKLQGEEKDFYNTVASFLSESEVRDYIPFTGNPFPGN